MNLGVVVLWVLSLVAPVASPSPVPNAWTVRISAADQISGLPISRAHVNIESDARSYDGYTDKNGAVVFEALPAAEYRIGVQHPDFKFADRTLAVGMSNESVRMLGTRSRLKAIATVQSRNAPVVAPAKRTSEDGQSSIAGSVGSALPSLPSLDTAPNGSILIHGHDPSITATTLNGAAIFPNGSGAQLGLLGSDSFSSGQTGPGSTAGGPDGTLALSTYDPTIDPQGLLQSRIATFGSTAYGFRATGTSGRIGASFVHSNVNVADAFNGAYFSDTSGRFYQHDTVANSSGDTVTLRYGLNVNNVTWVDFGRLSDNSPRTCRAFTARLPCGYGPRNFSAESVQFVQLRDQIVLDRFSLDLHVFQSTDRADFNFGSETFFGQPIGNNGATQTSRIGISAAAHFLVTPNRTVSLTASGSRDRSTSSGIQVNSEYRYPPSTETLGSLALDVPLVQTRKATFAGTLGAERSGTASGAFWGLNGNYRLTPTDALNMRVTSGRLAQPLFASGLSMPETLTYDCARHRALGYGPGNSTLGGAKTEQYNLSFTHTGFKTSAGVELFRTVDHNGVVNGIVPATALGNIFPVDYFGALNRDATLACGSGVGIGMNDAFFHVAGLADRLVTNGADLSLTSNIGDKAKVELRYALLYQRPYGLSSIVKSDPEVRPGFLVPGIPAHKFTGSLSFAASRDTTVYAALNYTGANSAFRRSSYSTVDLGARLRAASGDLFIGVQNVFNTASEQFSRFAPFPYLSQPIAPRTFSFRYRLALGQQNIDKTQPLSVPFLNDATHLSFSMEQFEKADPRSLYPLTTTPTCGPENLPAAKALFAEARSYKDYVENERLAGNKGVIQPRHTALADFSYIAMGDYYTIAISLPRSIKAAGPFLRCAKLESVDFATAQRLKIYMPGWRTRYKDAIFVLYYAPQVGLYFAPGGADETSSATVTVRPFPDTRPITQITIDPASCPGTYRSAVQSALDEIKSYIEGFYGGRHPAPPPGFRIAAHSSKNGPWLEIRADDFGFDGDLGTCLDVPLAMPKELQAHGISGAIQPSINYAPGVGFYYAPFIPHSKV